MVTSEMAVIRLDTTKPLRRPDTETAAPSISNLAGTKDQTGREGADGPGAAIPFLRECSVAARGRGCIRGPARGGQMEIPLNKLMEHSVSLCRGTTRERTHIRVMYGLSLSRELISIRMNPVKSGLGLATSSGSRAATSIGAAEIKRRARFSIRREPENSIS
jgi:hypothetical protein